MAVNCTNKPHWSVLAEVNKGHTAVHTVYKSISINKKVRAREYTHRTIEMFALSNVPLCRCYVAAAINLFHDISALHKVRHKFYQL